MAIRTINRDEWTRYFDDFSKKIKRNDRNDYVEIRILSQESGDQVEAEWLPLKGITYDEKSDSVYITLEQLNHQISHPAYINVDEDEQGYISSLEIAKQGDEKNILELR
ncbi:MAG: DUF5335 family protein [Bacteroidota bacterium]|jgi:uncharacterized protein YuzE